MIFRRFAPNLFRRSPLVFARRQAPDPVQDLIERGSRVLDLATPPRAYLSSKEEDEGKWKIKTDEIGLKFIVFSTPTPIEFDVWCALNRIKHYEEDCLCSLILPAALLMVFNHLYPMSVVGIFAILAPTAGVMLANRYIKNFDLDLQTLAYCSNYGLKEARSEYAERKMNEIVRRVMLKEIEKEMKRRARNE